MAQPQHACIVRSNVDGVSNSHTARKLELARSDGCPFAAWCTPAQRMSADNGERTAASIRCEPSDGLVRNLLRAPIAGDCEQPIAPRCHKYRRFRHGLPSLSQLSRAIRVEEIAARIISSSKRVKKSTTAASPAITHALLRKRPQMIGLTNLTASIQTAVNTQTLPTKVTLVGKIGRPGDSVTLNPQPLPPKPLPPMEVFANVKAALNATQQHLLHLPPVYHTLMEKSDPTDPGNSGGGEGGGPVIDPSGSGGWRAGVGPDISTVLDTDPRSASRSNSVHTPDPQDPDTYFGFQTPDPKGKALGKPDPRDKTENVLPGAGLTPLPAKEPGNVIDDPEPILKHKRDD